MPAIKFPTSDIARVGLLNQIVTWAETEVSDGRETLPAEVITLLSNHLALFTPLAYELQHLKAKRIEATLAKRKAVDTLSRYVRGFRQGVLSRQKMDLLSDGYPLFFGIGDSPLYLSAREWMNLAEKYLNGERAAVAKGYPPMSNPTASELQEKREAAEHAVDVALSAANALDHQQHITTHIRQEADRLLRITNTHLGMMLYGQDADDIRRIKRRYGFRYDIDRADDEKPDNE